MKPESQYELPDEGSHEVPLELVRALARLRESKVKVPPSVDAAILQSAKIQMAAIRQKRGSRMAIRWLWPMAAAACFLVAWLALSSAPPAGKGTSAPVARQDVAASIILREFSALYPNQVKSIVRNSLGIELALADKPDVAPVSPLVLKVCDPRGCEEIITFSGQSIDVAGHKVTVETESGGRVILDGEQFLWSSDFKGNPAPGIHIESRRL